MVALGRLATIALASHPCTPTRGGLAMNIIATCSRQPWNKGKLVGQKTPLRLRDIWAIRVRLHTQDHLSTWQYARIVKGWVKAIGLDPVGTA